MNAVVHPSLNTDDVEPAADARFAKLAPRPQALEEVGLSERFVADLISKHLHSAGTLTLAELSKRLRLSGPIIEKVLNFMRREARIEVKARLDGSGTLPYALTDHGRNTAHDAFGRSGYVGPAPVPLVDYTRVVQAQSVHARKVDRDSVMAALEGMVMPQHAADQFGISINSGKPVFIYGPAGTGKTYVTTRLARLFHELTLIPHAISVNETVVQLFDPLLHKAVDPGAEPGLMLEQGHDPRYVACERPVIITGGELTIDLLDIRYDAATRQYEAPLQLKANNGMFVIDDLGRQKVSPDALLNRWIVPMNDRRDYHSLGSGRHFVAPFDVVLVFSSNLHPLDLADEAFLRRIGHKIYCGHIRPDDYRYLWATECEQKGVEFDPDVVEFTLSELHGRKNVPLLPCHPRDLIGIALDKALYTGAPYRLTPDLLEWAWNTYFVATDGKAGQSRPSRIEGVGNA